MRRLYISGILAGSGTVLYQYEYKYRANQFQKKEVIGDMRQQAFNIRILTLLPLNICSRIWGKINSIDIPVFLRSRLLSIYVRRYNCDLSEAADSDLSHYSNLGEFFRRKLKPELRPINQNYVLVSPCDGHILSACKIESNEIEQIKDKTYNLHFFLGPYRANASKSDNINNIEVSAKQLVNDKKKFNISTKNNVEDKNKINEDISINEYLHNKNNCLYQCVFYLSPGDYHCFHSPANWNCFYRRYFPGYLFGVSPKRAASIPQLFNLNERVGYFGEWTGGFFNMTAIGATNVGSIRVYQDSKLSTNKKLIETENYVEEIFATKLGLQKGQPFGEFNFGSTIVLIFEAPKNFEFIFNASEKIKYGQALGQ